MGLDSIAAQTSATLRGVELASIEAKPIRLLIGKVFSVRRLFFSFFAFFIYSDSVSPAFFKVTDSRMLIIIIKINSTRPIVKSA